MGLKLKDTRVTLRFEDDSQAREFLRLVEAASGEVFTLCDTAQHGGAEGDDYRGFTVVKTEIY